MIKLDAHLINAEKFVELLRLQVHDKEIPETNRVRAAAACLTLAQEHHHAIVLLLKCRFYGSAFALVRLAFEACIRGEWLAYCATESELQQYVDGREPPKQAFLIAAIERTLNVKDGGRSAVMKAHWSAMCDYTHTGSLHAQRWQNSDAVESSYDEDEIIEVLKFSEIFGAMAAVTLLGIANDSEGVDRITRAFPSYD